MAEDNQVLESLIPEVGHEPVTDFPGDSFMVPEQLFAESSSSDTGMEDVVTTVEVKTTGSNDASSMDCVSNAVEIEASDQSVVTSHDTTHNRPAEQTAASMPGQHSSAIIKLPGQSAASAESSSPNQGTSLKKVSVPVGSDLLKQGNNKVVLIPMSGVDPSLLQNSLKVPSGQNIVILKADQILKTMEEKKLMVNSASPSSSSFSGTPQQSQKMVVNRQEIVTRDKQNGAQSIPLVQAQLKMQAHGQPSENTKTSMQINIPLNNTEVKQPSKEEQVEQNVKEKMSVNLGGFSATMISPAQGVTPTCQALKKVDTTVQDGQAILPTAEAAKLGSKLTRVSSAVLCQQQPEHIHGSPDKEAKRPEQEKSQVRQANLVVANQAKITGKEQSNQTNPEPPEVTTSKVTSPSKETLHSKETQDFKETPDSKEKPARELKMITPAGQNNQPSGSQIKLSRVEPPNKTEAMVAQNVSSIPSKSPQGTQTTKEADEEQNVVKESQCQEVDKVSQKVLTTESKVVSKTENIPKANQGRHVLQVPKVMQNNYSKPKKSTEPSENCIKLSLITVPKILSEITGNRVAQTTVSHQAGFSVRPASQGTPGVMPVSRGMPRVRPISQGTPGAKPVSQGTLGVRPVNQSSVGVRLVSQGMSGVKPVSQGTSGVGPASQGTSGVKPISQGSPIVQSANQGSTVRPANQLATGSATLVTPNTKLSIPVKSSPRKPYPKRGSATPSVFPSAEHTIVKLGETKDKKPVPGRGRGRPRKNPAVPTETTVDKKAVKTITIGPTLSGELEKRNTSTSFTGRLKSVRPGDTQLKPLQKTKVSIANPWNCSLCGKTAYEQSLGCLYGPYDENKDGSQTDNQLLGQKRKHESADNEMATSTKLKPDASSGFELWFHGDCAVWTPGIFATGELLAGYKQAVKDAKFSKCSRCGDFGATLACLQRTCKKLYHFSCAKQAGCIFEESNYTIQCDHHKCLATKKLQCSKQS